MRVLTLIIILMLIGISSAAKVYELHTTVYAEDKVDLISINISESNISHFMNSEKNNYYFQIISKDNRLLFNESFRYEFSFREFSGIMRIDKIEDFWKLPYFDDAKNIQLFHGNKKIWEQDVEDLREMANINEKTSSSQCLPIFIMITALSSIFILKIKKP